MVTPGTIEALRPGDHACLTFSDSDERLDIVAAFVAGGLRAGHKVLCLTEQLSPDRLTEELTQRLAQVAEPLRIGQLTIQGSEQAWLADGTPNAARMIDMLAEQLERASGEGYPGLQVSADMVWATRPLAAIDQLLVFETDVATLFGDGRLTAICQYDRDSFDPVTLASAAQAHEQSVAAAVYHEDPLLRVCRHYSPPGVRVAGELDAGHAEALTEALTESIRLDQDVYVNLAPLRFIDAASASVIVRAALSLPEERRLTVVCGGLVEKMIRLAGAHDVPQLRVQVAHDQH